MAIIRDYKLGNIRIKVDDQYCQKQTDEELKQIMQNVSDINISVFVSTASKRTENKRETTNRIKTAQAVMSGQVERR